MLRWSGHLPFGMKPGTQNQSLRLVKGANPTANETSDADLLESVRAGNARAAAAFHDRVLPVVVRTVGRLLGGRDSDYDDVLQQALIELVTTADRFLGQCPLDAWTSIISARVVYRHLRRRKIERRLFVLQGADTMENVARAPSSQVTLRTAIRRVESHLQAIDQKKAWTFILHDVHGYNLVEIAEITGASVTAVQSRLVRARKELHSRIAASGDLPSKLVDLIGQEGEP